MANVEIGRFEIVFFFFLFFVDLCKSGLQEAEIIMEKRLLYHKEVGYFWRNFLLNCFKM